MILNVAVVITNLSIVNLRIVKTQKTREKFQSIYPNMDNLVSNIPPLLGLNSMKPEKWTNMNLNAIEEL